MRSAVFKASWLLFVLPLLSGCLGMEVFFPEKEPVWTKPTTGVSDGTRSGFPPSYGSPAFELGTTCADVVSHRGKPDHESVKASESTLVYRQGLVWVGIMPIVVIPIPLALPLFSDSVTYTCKDDRIISVYRRTTRMVGAVCGMLDEAGNWGCQAQ